MRLGCSQGVEVSQGVSGQGPVTPFLSIHCPCHASMGLGPGLGVL